MSCEKWKEVDLADFIESGAGMPFERHVADCSDCRAELQIWQEMTGLLRRGAEAHPSPAVLVRWLDARDQLPATEATRLAAHFASCRPCAEEIATLQSFDLGRLVATPPQVAQARFEARPGPVQRLRAWLAEIDLRPAYGLAVAGIVAVVLVRSLGSETPQGAPPLPPPITTPVQVARAEAPPIPVSPLPPALGPAANEEEMAANEPRAIESSAAALDAKRRPPSSTAPASAASDPRARETRPQPDRHEQTVIARAEPPPPSPEKAAADAVLDRFLSGSDGNAKPEQPHEAAPSTATRPQAGDREMPSSALGFAGDRHDGTAGDGAWSVVALDEARRAIVSGVSRGIRLRLRPPQGDESSDQLRVTFVAPGGERWTSDASDQARSGWFEVVVDAARVRTPGTYTITVSALDSNAGSRAYDAVLEIR